MNSIKLMCFLPFIINSGVFWNFCVQLKNKTEDGLNIFQTLCGEIPLFIKEHKDGMYRTDVYYLCKVITALPISVSLACFTTSMCYYAVGLNPEFSRYLTAVGLTMLVALCSEGLGKLAQNMIS